MKKQLFNVLLCVMMVLPFGKMMAQSTVVDGQSTEGKDFWVTFMQADQKTSDDGDWDGNYNTLILSLSISSRENCQVTIENPFTGYKETVDVTANEMKLVELYKGHPRVTEARAAMKATKKVCYAVNDEVVDTCALHVTSTANISLFATNYKKATFDATNVLPTPSLLKEYIIQSYTPSDHKGGAQGTHFAVIAVENNTKVWYTPSVLTPKNRSGYDEYLAIKDKEYVNNPFLSDEENAKAKEEFDKKKADLIAQWGNFVIGEHTDSVVLQKGQVYYVWTGGGEGDEYDLSGSYVKANKNIAVFQGSPHTNIPKNVKQRDHIFSQAMPTQYWGNTFALTASSNRPSDIIRVMALNDETTVFINGDSVYTFDFSTNKKHYWEFEIGTQGNYAKNGSCMLTTSCPCAVHLFLVSQEYHSKTDGDPAMLWINPIEQQIDQVTFATYASSNGTTKHYVNIVTDQPALMKLDGASIQSDFKQVSGSSTYYYAQKSLGNEATSHTLKSDGSKFIAHVYGFTANESYGYSAGGATKPLTQYITINGKVFTPDSENTLCGDDTIRFACHPDYEYEKIEWYFGDGESNLENKDSVPHEYKEAGVYDAYVLIYRKSSNVCVGQSAVDSIPITVTIGNYKVDIKQVEMPYCTQEGEETDLTIHLYNPSNVSLTGDSVSIEFKKEEDGLTNDMLTIQDDTTLVIHLPGTVKDKKDYSLHIHIGSECPNSVLDKDLVFAMHFDKPYLTQRYNNVLGLLRDSFPNQELSNFVWFHDGDTVPNEQTGVLYLEEDESNNGEYYVCFNVHEEGKADYNYCTCPVTFTANDKKHEFDPETTDVTITATYVIKGDNVFVNADWNGKTDIECYAQWIMSSGQVYNNLKFNIPDGGCTIPVPDTNGFYLLRVYTDGLSRSFKFIIDK